MSEHWNIQINIQHVTEEPGKPGFVQAGKPPVQKSTTDVLRLAVVAETEKEAYEKAHRMLVANNPETVVVQPGEAVPNVLKPVDGLLSSPRPIRDNPQA